MAWATIEQLVTHLGVPQDGRMSDDLAASLAWCHAQRRDLDPNTPVHADIQKAVVIYAALLYRERSTPSGFAGYDNLEAALADNQNAMANVYRLLKTRKMVAR